jgi:predicted Rossmann fold nucleotide-binding protein DprA/Smf involved in DNA uptake
MAKAKATPTAPAKAQPPSKPAPAAARTKAAAAQPATEKDPAFDALWGRFCVEANFNPETLEAEAAVVREELARLEERLAEKNEELDTITRREGTARDKMAALLKVGFGSEAVLSAMKVEFKARKAPLRAKEKELDVGDEEKTAVLDVLDREGQPIAEVARHTGRDPKELQRILNALAAEGKVVTQGERKGKLYILA